MPLKFDLLQNYPNPFIAVENVINKGTIIKFAIPKTGKISLKIYDALGRETRTLIDDIKDAGFYSVIWNGKNDSGKPVSAGIYFYNLKANGLSKTKRIIIQK
jgi:flagellar hook assembly protein FlgD